MNATKKESLKICVIGAGVAGLQTAVQLINVGFDDITIFEKSDNVGGVWRENYADFGLQVPKELYEFPDFPFPTERGEEWETFPKGEHVQKYIELYLASKKGLRERIVFRTSVQSIERPSNESEGWIVKTSTTIPSSEKEEGATKSADDEAKGDGSNPSLTTHSFDYVVVCTGMYTAPPNVPGLKTPGNEDFSGEILHSSAFTSEKAKSLKDRDVVVVGGGKSAVDCAVAASNAGAKSTTIVFREAHWPVPRYLLNLVPFKWGTYSRFGHATLRAHHDASFPLLHWCMRPAKWAWWRIVETMFRCQFGLSGDMLPKSRIDVDLFGGGQILTYAFHRLVREGKIRAVRSSVARLDAKDVILRTDERISADAVVYATGFSKSYAYLDAKERAKLSIEKDGLWLYRNIIPPQVPRLAFVGSEVTTFNNILTHALQAKWLASVLSGKIAMPAVDEMERAIAKEQAWKRSWMPEKSTRAATYQLHMLKLHDTYVEDMRISPWRKGWNVLAEMFAPYEASDYAALF